MNSDTFHTLTRGDTIGLVLIAEAGVASVVAISVIFFLILRNIVRQRRLTQPPAKWHLIQGPMDLYMLSLFAANMVQALGAVGDIRWIQLGSVVTGKFCTAQGVVQQLGETSLTITTLAISVHTFVVVWWQKGTHSLLVAKIITAALWLYAILFTAVNVGIHSEPSALYIVPTPYWCWIGSNYLLHRIFGLYIWFWVTAGFTSLVFIPLYFCSRGIIVADDKTWWKFTIVRRQKMDESRIRSLSLIFYALGYSILFFPVMILRWVNFAQPGNRVVGVFIVSSMYYLNGVYNVILFLLTRPGLLLFTLKRTSPLARSTLDPSDSKRAGAHGTHGDVHTQPYREQLDVGRLPEAHVGEWGSQTLQV